MQTPQSLILEDVLKALQESFPSVAVLESCDNGYDYTNFEINGDKYCIERNGTEWYWTSGKDTDNENYGSLAEALQAARNYADQKLADEEAEKEEAYNDKHFGTYNDQVRRTFRSMTGGDL